jgi:16S rRNA (adenine1518-N6/adenine1519-N6)-dimethyltransferase
MNLTSPSQVKDWCIKNGFHPNRVMGQNFLVDKNVLCAIVDVGLGERESYEGVKALEIGPGLGVMTEEMLLRGCSVTAIEKDTVLAERLPAALNNPPLLNVIAADALDVVAARSIDFSAYDCMISNLPYQAGTRILLDIAAMRALPSIVVMVQTEVADRLAAPEGSKTRSLAGVWVQLDYDVKVIRKVSASCFWPRPEVGSAVVRLVRHDRNVELPDTTRAMYRRLVKRAFEHRRKQLGSIFKGILDSTARAEELTCEEWISIASALCAEGISI